MHSDNNPPTQFLRPALFDNTKSGVQGRGVTANAKRSKACHDEVRRRFLASGMSKDDFILAHAKGVGAGTKFSDGEGGTRAYSEETLEAILENTNAS